jgi:hypothetical protein
LINASDTLKEPPQKATYILQTVPIAKNTLGNSSWMLPECTLILHLFSVRIVWFIYFTLTVNLFLYIS